MYIYFYYRVIKKWGVGSGCSYTTKELDVDYGSGGVGVVFEGAKNENQVLTCDGICD